VNAAERPRTTLPIFDIIQERAGGEEPLVGDAVVPREHLEMGHQIHARELTPDARAKQLNTRNVLHHAAMKAADIADTIMAALGMPRRALWPELAVFVNNPWKE
jgi:hypothetical protein